MRYRFLLCDDSEEHLYILEEYIKKLFVDKNVSYTCHKTTSGTEAFEMYMKQKYDVVFMDIIMPEISGFEVSKKIFEIDSDAVIVYVTSYMDYAVKAFEQFAFHYLIKPITEEKLSLVLEKAFQKIEKDTLYKNEKSFFIIRKNSKEIKVMNDDVLFFEKVNNYIHINMENHKDEKIRMTLKELEDVIDMEKYLRCHNGFIVNISKIKSISTKEIELLNTDIKIPVGRGYKNEIVCFFEKAKGKIKRLFI